MLQDAMRHSTARFDASTGPPGPEWTLYSVGRGRVERVPGVLRLATEDAPEGVLADAQLDDYHGRTRAGLRWRPPLRLEVRARWSHPRHGLRGTTGFGFWNDPVDGRGRFAAAPSWLWFFHASPPSCLRLGDGRGTGDGFVAGAMRGRTVGRVALLAGNLALRTPGLARLAARLGERQMRAGDVVLPAETDLDLRTWHDYALTWDEAGARFAIDGAEVAVLPSEALPAGPLGFVAWIDNNWAALGEDGSYRAGRLAAPGLQWLDLARVEIRGADPDRSGD